MEGSSEVRELKLMDGLKEWEERILGGGGSLCFTEGVNGRQVRELMLTARDPSGRLRPNGVVLMAIVYGLHITATPRSWFLEVVVVQTISACST